MNVCLLDLQDDEGHSSGYDNLRNNDREISFHKLLQEGYNLKQTYLPKST